MKRATLIAMLALQLFSVSLRSGDVKAETNFQKPLKLPELIGESLERNPEIIAAREKWQSAQEIIEAKRALPDPEFSYTYFIDSIETRVGPQNQIFGAKQKFPFYGKRDLRAEVASKEAEVLEATYEAVKHEIVRRVKRSYYELFYITMLIDITEKEKEILRQFEHIARAKYATGKGSQQSILKVHVEMSQLEDRLLALGDQRQTAEAIINVMLDRAPEEPLGKPEKPKFREFYYVQPELFRLSKENRPELRAGIALIEKSEKAYNLTRKEYYPDLTVGLNYFQIDDGPLPFPDNGEDAFNVMFSINIPIWGTKLSSQVRSASQMIRAQKSEYENILNRTLFDVKDNYFKIETARETFDLYKNVLLLQAEQSMKSAEVGYTTGITDFLNLLDAERVFLKIQYGYWRAYTDYLARIADMERAVGVELPEYRPEAVPSNVKED